MYKEAVSRFQRWYRGDFQIDGLLPTCDSYPSSPTGLRLQQVDLNNLHPLWWVQALLKRFVWNLFEHTDAVLLCNDDPIIAWRQREGFVSMHMRHRLCGQVTYLVIAMQSQSRAPQEGLR